MKIFVIGIDHTTISLLRSNGSNVTKEKVESAEELPELLSYGDYEVLLLNLDLRDWEISSIRYLRNKDVKIPIIGIMKESLHTSWSESRADFLENGGDDLVRTPASPRELIASASAAIRRGNLMQMEIQELAVGSAVITINLLQQLVTVDGELVRLTGTEFRILESLARYRGLLKSRNTLMNVAYSDGEFVDDRTVDSHIKRLRIKLSRTNPDAYNLISTVYGSGYKIATPEEMKENVA